MQVEAVATLVNGVNENLLHSCLEKQRRINPSGTQAQHIAAVAKRIVPTTVPGSPSYHRGKLQDLLAMVDRHGIPSLFLTLTADEVSEVRWGEVADMEDVLRNVTGSDDLTSKDMPVEMARLFTDRVNNFMQRHILCKRNPALGRIQHWVIRYEAQVRHAEVECCSFNDSE